MAEPEEILALPEQMDISAAEHVQALLREKLSYQHRLVLNGENVARLTTPCVQLLLAFFRQRHEQMHATCLIKPSDAFNRTLTDLGLSRELETWRTQHA